MSCILNHIKIVVQIKPYIYHIIRMLHLEPIYGKLFLHGYNDAISHWGVYDGITGVAAWKSNGYIGFRFYVNSSYYELSFCWNNSYKLSFLYFNNDSGTVYWVIS